ncbi:MAG: transporter permease [Bacteroidetes bacterium]|nr:transporter permease [Bacteroidota bacterium]
MNFHSFISAKISASSGGKKSIARPIVKIAVGGIALGIAVMIITLAIVTGFQNEIKSKVIGFGSHISIVKMDNNVSFEPQPIAQNQGFILDLRSQPYINYIQVFATKNGIIRTKTDNEGVVVKGVDKRYNWDFLQKNLKAGKVIDFADSASSKEILISQSIADKLNVGINDKLLVYFINKKPADDSVNYTQYEQRVRDFRVCGIYDTGFEELDSKTVFADIRQIRRLNYWAPDQVGGFEIGISDLSKIDQVNDEVNEVIGYEYSAQSIKESNSGIFSWLDLMDSNAIIIISLMIAVAAINMISALLILILERTNMIGLLKALGSTNAGIRIIFLHQASRLIGKGLIAGNTIGIGLCLLQKYFHWIRLDKKVYYIDFVPVNFDIIHVLLLNVGTIVVCFLMMLLPTLVITRITPIKALRFR